MSNLAFKKENNYSYSDYKNWDDNARWELIHGKAYNMSPAPLRTHQKISGNIFFRIRQYLEDKQCEVYCAPFDVCFANYPEQPDTEIETVVQPDIAVICDEKKLTDYGCKGSPDIIIEILSPASSKKDKSEKFKLYEEYKVKEYWIVYPDLKILEIFKLSGDKYMPAEVFGTEDVIEVKLLGDLIINVNDVFK